MQVTNPKNISSESPSILIGLIFGFADTRNIPSLLFSIILTTNSPSYRQRHASPGIGEGILPINDFQRRLLTAIESFTCREAQIKNLIRAVRKYLASEQFGTTQQRLNSEIERVQRNTIRDRERLTQLQFKAATGIEGEFGGEEEKIAKGESELARRREIFEIKRISLDTEYHRKRRSFEKAIKNPEQFESYDHFLSWESTGTGQSDIRNNIGRVEGEIEKLDELRAGLERERAELIRAIEERDCDGGKGIHRSIKDILKAGEAISYTSGEENFYRRLRKAKESLTWGTWKTWV